MTALLEAALEAIAAIAKAVADAKSGKVTADEARAQVGAVHATFASDHAESDRELAAQFKK